MIPRMRNWTWLRKVSTLVRLESRNEALEDFNEEMEWDAENRIYEMQARLYNQFANYSCRNPQCYDYWGVWVQHCPECGGPVEEEVPCDCVICQGLE